MKTEAISLPESRRLIDLEKTIEAGRKTFVEVGTALAEIRDARLYRADFDTFEAYCKSKWSMGRHYANHIIDGAEAVKTLPAKMVTMVTTERQARELAKVEPEKRVEVLEKVAEAGPVTAKAIKEAVSEKDQKAIVPKKGRFEIHPSDVKKLLISCWRDRSSDKSKLNAISELLLKESKRYQKAAKAK